MKLHFEQLSEGQSDIVLHGSIRNVLEGRMPSELREQWVDVSRLKCGFLSGSPLGISSIGEVIVVDGVAYAKSADPQAEHFHQVISGSQVVSAGFCGLPFSSLPGWQVTGRGEAIVCSTLYRQIYDRIGCPYFLMALVTLGELRGTALTDAPIYGEAVFDKRERYWNAPLFKQQHGMACLVGVVADHRDEQLAELQDVIYVNPDDPTAEIPAHVHALTLKQQINSTADVNVDIVANVLHLLGDSTLTAVDGLIYPIARLRPF